MHRAGKAEGQKPMSSYVFTLPDGRQLGYSVEGEGRPIIYFHGTASSRLEIMLLREFAYANRFQLVGIDRPGYGLSTFKQITNLREFTDDVNALANNIGLSNFAVLSWSGGGPFALTYTALYPDRVTRAVVVGSPALPFDPSTAHNNNPFAKIAMRTPILARLGLNMFRRSVLRANQDIESYLESRSGKRMLDSWPKPDARFFADPKWLKLMYAAMAEGFRQNGNSIKAIYQEHYLFIKPWNEPIWQIPTGKLTLWQGAEDKTCPINNEQKIAQTIKSAQVKLFPDQGHCVMFAEPQKLAQALNS